MSLNWYPVINEDLCSSCYTCVDFCQNGVFEIKDFFPVVIKPENCVEFCRGCAKICPNEAITYYGDTNN